MELSDFNVESIKNNLRQMSPGELLDRYKTVLNASPPRMETEYMADTIGDHIRTIVSDANRVFSKFEKELDSEQLLTREEREERIRILRSSINDLQRCHMGFDVGQFEGLIERLRE